MVVQAGDLFVQSHFRRMDKKHLKSLDFGCFLFAQNPPDNPLVGNEILKQPRGTVRLPRGCCDVWLFRPGILLFLRFPL